MDYQETLSYLYNSTPVFQHVGGTAYKEGLDNSLALDEYLRHPHRRYATIHVGGTNGKGSTSHLLASILQQSGYRVGLYTSPHLLHFRERIRVDGEMISENYVVDFVARHRPFFEQIQPSFFELTMMMAFDYFAHCEVDIAVVEVGLGGRLDSTNILTPVLSVITNISLDHTQFLGDTEEKIAEEKAGIIKPGIPVVIGEAKGRVREVFERKAGEVAAPVVFAEDEPAVLKAEMQPSGEWLFQARQYPDLKGELGGWAQEKNANTVLCALQQLIPIFKILDRAVYDGFARVVEISGLQGRWQVVGLSPKVVLDTGHNEAGIRYIAGQLENEHYKNLHIVLGMVKDKDIAGILRLLPGKARYYFTKAAIPRSLPEADLCELAAKEGLPGESYPSVKEAVEAALRNASAEDLVFVGGSNFVVGEALEIFS